jgi:hypothetical protein
MSMTTLDDLIERLHQSREAAGRNLPVRLRMEMDLIEDDEAPPVRVVSIQWLKVMRCVTDDGEVVQIAAVGAAAN